MYDCIFSMSNKQESRERNCEILVAEVYLLWWERTGAIFLGLRGRPTSHTHSQTNFGRFIIVSTSNTLRKFINHFINMTVSFTI